MMYVNKTFNRTAKSTTVLDDTAEAMIQDIINYLVTIDGITALTGDEVGVKINNKIKILISKTSSGLTKTIVFQVRNDTIDLFTVSVGSQQGSGTTELYQLFRMNFHIAINDNVFSLIIRNGATTSENYFTANILMLTASNGVTVVGYNQNATSTPSASAAAKTRNFATDTTFWNLADNTQSITVAKRLPYSHESTNANIATLSDKILLSGALRVGDVPIMDCSTIVGDATYPFDGVTYYAIDDNTLIGGE